MTTRGRRVLALLALLAPAACGPGALAEADGARLEVEAAAQLIAEHSAVPGDTQVVQVVAELWVDYTLLARRLAADTMLASLDVGPLIETPSQEIMFSRLRDEVLEVDTAVAAQELAERFAADLPGARATASQILLLFPRSAGARQRDSVLAAARALREELARGADFATLAARHSGDPGSGSRGGSLGTFGRGQMLPPVDSAVFGLAPGELSAPVETQLGYHLLRLDAIEIPELSEVGAEFRRRIQMERTSAAEAAYMAQLDSASGLRLAADALGIARALMEAGPSRLAARAADRPLATWTDRAGEGGADGAAAGVYTAGDFLALARTSPDGFREGVLAASDDDLRGALRRVAQQEILVADAAARGFSPSSRQLDSLSAEARAAIRDRAGEIGLVPNAANADSTANAADSTANEADSTADAESPRTPAELVEAALARIVSGEREILPLGGVTFLLRDQGGWSIDAALFAATAARIGELQSP